MCAGARPRHGDLLRQSKDPLIRQALADIAEGYETLAKRAERAEGIAKPARLSPGVLPGLQWAGDVADAVVLT